MVIVNYKAGQLANRLFHFSHFLANSITYDYVLVYPYLSEYSHFFTLSQEKKEYANLKLRYTPFRLIDRKISRYISRFSVKNFLSLVFEYHDISDFDNRDVNFDMRKPQFTHSAKTKILVAHGWVYRDDESLIKNASSIRNFLTPLPEFTVPAQNIIKNIRVTADVIVGVHIRRGDYLEYENGKWYFEDDVYLRKMKEMEALLKGKSCVFLITSNENITSASFSGLNINCESRHFITDLYLLSLCDYIIGPPSTFSAWASFYGRIPLFHIQGENHLIELDKFHIVYDS